MTLKGIVAPAWTKLRLFILSRFGFKDVKRGWHIAISFTDSRVTVIHRRREASNEESTGVPNFEFSWELTMTFNRKMEKLEHASFAIVNMNISPNLNERTLSALRTTIQDWFFPGTDAFPCLSLFPVASAPIIANAISMQSNWVSAAVGTPTSSSKKDKKRKSLGHRTRDFLLSRDKNKHSSSTSITIPTPEIVPSPSSGHHVSIADTYVAVSLSSTPKSKPKLKTYLSSESGTTVPVVAETASNDSASQLQANVGTNAVIGDYSATGGDARNGKLRPALVRRLSDSSEAFASTRRKKNFGNDEPTVSTPTKSKRKSGNLTDGEENSKEIKSKVKARRGSDAVHPSAVVSFGGDISPGGGGMSDASSTASKKKQKRASDKVRSKRSKSIGSAQSQPSIMIESMKEVNFADIAKPIQTPSHHNPQLQAATATPPLRSSNEDILSMEEDVEDMDFDGEQGLDESDKSMSWSTDSSWSSIDTPTSTPFSSVSSSRKKLSREGRMRTLSSDSEGRAPNAKIRQSIRPQTSVGSPSAPLLAQHSSPNFSSSLTSTSVPDHPPHPTLASFSSPHFGTSIGIVHPSTSPTHPSNALSNSSPYHAPFPTSPTGSRRRLEDMKYSSMTAVFGSSSGSNSLNSSSSTINSAIHPPGSPAGSYDAGSRLAGKEETKSEKLGTPVRKKSISSTTREGLFNSPAPTRKEKDKR